MNPLPGPATYSSQVMLIRLIPISLALALLQVALRFKDDPDLARRLQARDAGAMRELYDRYGRLVYSLILRIVRNSAAAEGGRSIRR